MPLSKCRKIAIIGPSLVGKSALSFQFMEQKFLEDYDPTVENTYRTIVKINSQDYELILIDTAGTDEYSIFPAQYLIDVHGFVLVYDIINRKSLEVISTLRDRLLSITGNIKVPLVLVGNKVDLNEYRQVLFEDGKKLAEKWNVKFLETSAKNYKDVKRIFEALFEDIEKCDGNEPRQSCCIS